MLKLYLNHYNGSKKDPGVITRTQTYTVEIHILNKRYFISNQIASGYLYMAYLEHLGSGLVYIEVNTAPYLLAILLSSPQFNPAYNTFSRSGLLYWANHVPVSLKAVTLA